MARNQHVAPYGKDKGRTHWELDPDTVYVPLVTPLELDNWRARQESIGRDLEALRRRIAEATAQEKGTLEQELAKQIEALEKQRQERPFERAMAVRERAGEVAPTRILIRGNHLTPGDEVSAGVPSVFNDKSSASAIRSEIVASNGSNSYRTSLRELGVVPTSGGRRMLADWIANTANPLTPRVAVNRMWKQHFGRGIVTTSSDFGKTGKPPTHPELLDWLAQRLLDGAWHSKRLHRTLVLSHTYSQLSSDRESSSDDRDAANDLLGRQSLRRLDAELIRDAILAVNGKLNLELHGRGFFPLLSAEVLSSQSRPGHGWDSSSERDRARRSVYMYAKRTLGVPMMEVFDAPVPDKSASDRTTTTIAPQSLMLLNSDFVQEQAKAFAERLAGEVLDSAEARLAEGVFLAIGRSAQPGELRALVDFHRRQSDHFRTQGKSAFEADHLGLVECCRLLFNLNEFIYID